MSDDLESKDPGGEDRAKTEVDNRGIGHSDADSDGLEMSEEMIDEMVEADHSMVGEIVDSRYAVGQRLGAGGIGKVYKAERLQLGRVVAIKFLKREHAARPELRKRFAREALAMSRLYHRHVVSVIDFGVHLGAPYLVMEYVPGETLSDLLRDGPIEPKRVVAIMLQLLTALDYFHRQLVVHRDLKAANIMLAETDEPGDFVKLLDFGMAKLMAGMGAEIDVSVKGKVVGTPSTMSPEQIRELPIDARSDLYSAGIILFEMLTAQKVFPYRDPYKVLAAHVKEQPTPPRSIVGQDAFSEELEQVILRALVKDREKRFQTAKDMADALERTPEGGGASRDSVPGPEAEPAPRPAPVPEPEIETREEAPKRRGLVWFAALGWLLAGLLLAVVAVAVLAPDVIGIGGAERVDERTQGEQGEEGVRSPDVAHTGEAGSAEPGPGQTTLIEPDEPPEPVSIEPAAPDEPEPAEPAEPAEPEPANPAEPIEAAEPETARDAASPELASAPPDAAPEAVAAPEAAASPEPNACAPYRDQAGQLAAAGKYREAMSQVEQAISQDSSCRGDPGIIDATIASLALPDGDSFIPYIVRELGDQPAAVAALIQAVPKGGNWYVRHHAWIALSKLGQASKADLVGMWLADLGQAKTCKVIRRSYNRLAKSTDARAKRTVSQLRRRHRQKEKSLTIDCLATQLGGN